MGFEDVMESLGTRLRMVVSRLWTGSPALTAAGLLMIGVLAASIVAYLAFGQPVEHAVASGKEFVTRAIINALRIGHGTGPCDPLNLGG